MDALTIPLLNIAFNDLTQTEVVDLLLARPPGERFGYVVTPNADHIARLRRIPCLRGVYRQGMLCLLDSKLVGLFAQWLGLAVPEVVTGADLTGALLDRLEGTRAAVVGMTDHDFAVLTGRYPGVTFLRHAAPMRLLHDSPAFFAARDFVCQARMPFTFLALGSPVQELLAYAIAAQRDAVGMGLCIGAGLEFCAGTVRRAPLWMRQRGLEWLYRLACDPVRLAGRYLISDPRVLLALLIAAMRKKSADFIG